ncbi:MAG: hypothetical protein RSH26_00205 [Clostridia bacterium]
MRNHKIGSLLKIIGGILLAVSMFLLLSVSDVDRLNPMLNDVPNAQKYRFAHDNQVNVSVSALISAAEITEGMETDYSANAGSAPLPQAACAMNIDDTEYHLYSLDEFKHVGRHGWLEPFPAERCGGADAHCDPLRAFAACGRLAGHDG